MNTRSFGSATRGNHDAIAGRRAAVGKKLALAASLACALGCDGGSAGASADAAANPGPDGGLRASSAVYIVPAGPDTPETSYPIALPDLQIQQGQLRVAYNLPDLLVGKSARVSLTGPLDPSGTTATLTGDLGSATCDLSPGGGLILRCREMLTGVTVDLPLVMREAQNKDPSRVAQDVAVAQRFGSEPIGILEVR